MRLPAGEPAAVPLVKRLERLQKFGRFESLLHEHNDLAVRVSMRAGTKSWNGEKRVSIRFKQDRLF